MENQHVLWVNQLYMAIFTSYVTKYQRVDSLWPFGSGLRFCLQKELRIQTDGFTYSSVASAAKSGSSKLDERGTNVSAVWEPLHLHFVTAFIINIILSTYRYVEII